jgi:hypothetical protein
MDLSALNGILGLTGKQLVMAGVFVTAIGVAGQQWKAPKSVATWKVQWLMVLSCWAAWALTKLPEPGHIHEWLGAGTVFCIASLGVASGAAGFGLAPKTDSKP